jgi:hypothetical protein
VGVVAAGRLIPDNPEDVARFLDSLRRAGAHEQAAALADRAAADAALDDPGAGACLLASLQEAGAGAQVTALLRRDPAAHVFLDHPGAVACLLASLQEAGAGAQARAPADRTAAHDDPGDVTALLASLRQAGADTQARALADRLPGSGMFELFRRLGDRQDQFRFGRESDGSPAKPWDWGDLD